MMKKLRIGRKVIRLDSVNSTNLFARQLGSFIRPIHEGTIVIADHQYSGKGRHQRTWESEGGKNISMSIILYPVFLNASKVFYLSKAISVGIKSYLEAEGLKGVSIKWPNDIYIDKCKIAGILIENSWKGDRLQESVVGIGLNVNQLKFNEKGRCITSMRAQINKEYNLEDVLKKLTEHLQTAYLEIGRGAFEEVDQNYNSALYGKHKGLSFIYKGANKRGSIQAVDEQGKLCLIDEEKKEWKFDMDEVAIIYESPPND